MKILAKWTVEDYHRMIEAGILSDRSVELIEGEIIEVSPESPLHSGTIQGVGKYLRSILAGKADIREGHPITLSNSEPEPDLAIVSIKENNYSDRHPTPQDIFWLIEVSYRTLERDKHQKKKIYAAAQINEYWIIDLNAREIIVWREPEEEDYRTRITVNQGIISPVVFPDVKLQVRELLPK